jgi:hypothetical protein
MRCLIKLPYEIMRESQMITGIEFLRIECGGMLKIDHRSPEPAKTELPVTTLDV